MSNDTAPRPRNLRNLVQESVLDFRRQLTNSPADLSVWAKLYAAQQTMLSAMAEDRMSAALFEICANLLGCEQVAIVRIERVTGANQLLHQVGLSLEQRVILVQNTALLDSRIAPGAPDIPSEDREPLDSLRALGISALVPLWADERSSGALVLFQLSPHHNTFDAEDRELLQLLSIYAGPCMAATVDGGAPPAHGRTALDFKGEGDANR
jgi:hypothetical protein